MTLEDLQSRCYALSDELEHLAMLDDNDEATRGALRVTRACALVLVDEIDRVRRLAMTHGRLRAEVQAICETRNAAE
ncbi:MAG: hypothetical protein JST00_07070 [Deltaproteobacteria bacterium]|nr:hypothetical protein [Deltaproteobacteria bacterium]